MVPVPSPKGKRILSIDGGGFRGLGQLLIIDAITKAADALGRDTKAHPEPYKPSEVFDLTIGASTGGLVAILLGALDLDCNTAIAEYKALGQALFGNDRSKFLDVLTKKDATLPDAAYNAAIEALVKKYAGDGDKAWPDAAQPKTVVTTVHTRSTQNPPALARSWESLPAAHPASAVPKIRDLIRQTTAAPPYLSPLKVKNSNYIDSAYPPLQVPNATQLAQRANLWKAEELGVVLNVGQLFKENRIADYNSASRPPPEKESKVFIPDLLAGYTYPAAEKNERENEALVVIKHVLQQALRVDDVEQKLTSTVPDYIQIDPPLGIESWELVDIFESAKVEAAIKKYIGEPEGKLQIDAIAALLVVPAKKEDPSKPEEITPPKEEGCLPANPDCDKPRPTTEEDWLKRYQVIFVVDDSSSMILTENYSAIDERSWNEARNALAGIADVAFTLQVNSIDICFLNARAEHTGVKGSSALQQYMAASKPPTNLRTINRTPTGAKLKVVLDKVINRLEGAIGTDEYMKIPPTDVILITDGEADDNPGTVLTNAVRRMISGKHHPNYLNVQVVQVGQSRRSVAAKMTNAEIGEMVHVTPWDGELTYEKLKKIILGQIQPNVRKLLKEKYGVTL